MMYERPVIFWLVIVFVFCALLWLLSEVLLPFVAGVALAYVQVPLADRLERLGMNRTVAALLIVVTVVLALLAIALESKGIVVTWSGDFSGAVSLIAEADAVTGASPSP